MVETTSATNSVERNKSHSPRLEARGSEPTAPPPPPRWCKPPLVPTPPPLSTTNVNPVVQVSVVAAENGGGTPQLPDQVEEEPTPVPVPVTFQKKQQQPARRPLMSQQQRRRRPRRQRSSSSGGQSAHCHHSSLADKASDYEDIWGTSPGASDNENVEQDQGSGSGVSAQALAPKPLLAALLANQEDTALSDHQRESYRSTSSSDRNSCSSSSSTSSLHKSSSVSSCDRVGGTSPTSSSHSLCSGGSPEPDQRPLPPSESTQIDNQNEEEDVEPIEPPLLFQQPRQSTGSVTIVQIGGRNGSPDVPMIDQEEDEEENDDSKKILAVAQCQVEENNKENNLPLSLSTIEPPVEELTVRRRTSCNGSSSAESSKNNSRRTSPLYSEPADALPPQLAAQYWIKNGQQSRPLPMPPSFPSAASDFTTFTKDGYVRCTIPTVVQSPKISGGTVLPSQPQRPASGNNNKSKQVGLPKPPRQLPPPAAATTTTASTSEHRKIFPSLIYLPTVNEDNSLTIQVLN